MSYRNFIRIENASAEPLKIVLEPYATEFLLPSGSQCEVIGRSEQAVPEFSIEHTAQAMVIWGLSPGAIYEYWQDGRLVD